MSLSEETRLELLKMARDTLRGPNGWKLFQLEERYKGLCQIIQRDA